MKKLILILVVFGSIAAQAQKRNSWGGAPGKFYLPLYQHKTDAPSTSNPPILVMIADSIGSSTVPNALYSVDSLGQHPFSPGTGGSGGGGGPVIGNSVGGGTSGSVLYVDGSNNLAQNNAAYYWDPTNQALGINNNNPYGDLNVTHNESGPKIPGLVLDRFGAFTGADVIDFIHSRGTRSSPTEVNSGDSLGAIRWRSYNGTINQTAAEIDILTQGTVSTTSIPSVIQFATNNTSTPSLLTPAASIDDAQAFNILHPIMGSASTIADANRGASIAEIFGTDPNLAYAAHLILCDNTGVGAGNGPKLMFGTEFSSNSWTGGGYIKGYKANGTSGDYGAGLQIFTRTNGSSQSEAIRWNELQHTLIGGISTDQNSWLTIAANTTTTANLFLGGASADVSSPTNGMMWYNSTAHTLNFRDNGVTTNLLATASTPSLQQVFNVGTGGTAALTKADTISSANNFYIGNPSSAMPVVAINANVINLNGATAVAGPFITSGITSASDANTTVTYGSSPTYGLILPLITANRTLTLPSSPPTGWHFTVFNRNTSGTFSWSFAGSVNDATGTAITTMANGTVYELIYDGSNYIKVN